MRKLIFYLGILSITTSCAGFKNTNFTELNKKNNLQNINGTYKSIPTTGNGFYVNTLTDVFDRNINMFNLNKKYNNEDAVVKLKMINENRLHVEISELENILFSKNLRIKLKNDGFIYLKNKRLMVYGLLLIFGGWNFQKSRLSLDSNNNLKVHSNYFFCNGVLILMSDWKTFHYDLTFQKQ